MSVQDFIFRIGADVSEFEKSITEVEAELNRWKNTLKTASKEGIVEANKNIVLLTKSIEDLKKVGLDKLPSATANGTNALFSLSQVARDLPFGFIAIQNNLPLVIDQFSALAKSSGGVGGAFKSLGAALVGPAGISFAFGAAIAGVTALTQQYGSIGNAIKELFGINTQLSESQKAYNDQVAKTTANLTTEQAKVDILTKTLLDNKKPQSDRIAAYEELKRVAPNVVAGIRDENALTKEANLLIEQQAEQRKQLIRLKIQEAGINAALNSSAEQLAVKDRELTNAQEDKRTAYLNLQKVQKNEAKLVGQTLTNAIQAAFDEFKSSEKAVQDLEIATSNLRKEQDQYLAKLDPIVNQISQINKVTNDRIQAVKDQIKAEDQAIKTSEKNAKKKKTLTDQEIREQEQLERQIQESNNRIANFRAKELEKQAEKNRAVAKKEAERTAKEELIAFEKVQQSQTGEGIFIDSKLKQKLDESVKSANLAFGIQLIEDTFFGPLQNAFNDLLTNTEFTFKEFGNIVKQAIARLVSQIIATGIIQLIATILSGGFAAIPGGGGFAKGISSVFQKTIGSLGFIAPQKIANPSFSNVNGGNLGLTGAVNLTLRGSDLVGAMNRTNTTINRVG